MADAVILEGEVSLNSIHFPLQEIVLRDGTRKPGMVRREIVSRFADKMTIGDDTYSNERFLSNLISKDQKGGILVEEMDERIHGARSWWSNLNEDFLGHSYLPTLATEITLPSLPTITDGGVEIWTDDATLTNWTKTETNGATLSKESTEKHGGTYSACFNNPIDVGRSVQIVKDFTTGWTNNLRGATVRICFWAKLDTGGNVLTATLSDGVGSAAVNATQNGTWVKNVITRRLDVVATKVELTLYRASDAGGTRIAYIDDVSWDVTSGTVGNLYHFNGDLFCTNGSIIYKLDSSTGSAFFIWGVMPAAVTKLVSSVGNCLYVLLGDSDYYWYMSPGGGTLVNGTGTATGSPITLVVNRNTITVTAAGTFTVTIPANCTGTATSGTCTVAGSPQALTAGANTVTITGTGNFTVDTYQTFTQTDSANATKGVHHVGKLYKLNLAGQLSHAATPNTASPSWTNVGTLADAGLPSGAVNSLVESRDATGNIVIYADTKYGRFVHDDTTSKWLATELVFANHANGGKGSIRWNDADWVSAGTTVKRYAAGGTAIITDEGLDKDDGLPAEFAGEIVDLIKGTDCFYALVDASQAAGTAFSSVIKRTLYGWHGFWDATMLDSWLYGFTGASGTAWANLANAYDNSTGTAATAASIAAATWSGYAVFTLAATKVNAIRFYSTDGTSSPQVDIDVSADGVTYTDVYEGTFTASAWNTYRFGMDTIINVRVRMKNGQATPQTMSIMEVQYSGGVTEGTMHSGIVSTAYDYRFWFDHDGKLYWITLSKNLTNPKKISGWTYQNQGLRVTPWFDAGIQAKDKTAFASELTGKDLTASETIKVKYRLNHSSTALFSGWTDLATISADGVTETKFGSSVGITNKAIQLRFDLIRGSTNTLSPDLSEHNLAFRKDNDYRLGWAFRIDCTQTYNGMTPMELQAALDTIIAAKTFLPFNIRHPTQDISWPKYVMLVPPAAGPTQTGRNFESQYELMVVKP